MPNLLIPKILVTLFIVVWCLVTGYFHARQTSFNPTLGDTINGAVRNSPYLLFLVIPLIWVLL